MRQLTLTLAALMTVQSLTGVIAPDHYRDVEWIKATWLGNDWLTLIVAAPLLMISGIAAQSGSARPTTLYLNGGANPDSAAVAELQARHRTGAGTSKSTARRRRPTVRG